MDASTPYQFGQKTVTDVLGVQGIVAVIMGDSGTGKTTLLKSLPPERTCVYDIDGGVSVLAGWPGKVEQAPKDLSNLKAFVEWATTAQHGITTFVVDSVSNLERRMLFLMGDLRKKEFVDVREYGDTSTKLRQYLVALADLRWKGINVIFICHTKTDVKGRDGVIFPMLSDKLAVEILGLVDMAGYLGVHPDGTRFLQFQPAPNVRAKTRFPEVQPFEVLDIAQIFAKVIRARRAQVASGSPAPVAAPPVQPPPVTPPAPPPPVQTPPAPLPDVDKFAEGARAATVDANLAAAKNEKEEIEKKSKKNQKGTPEAGAVPAASSTPTK